MSPNVPATRELPAIEAALEPHVERIRAAAADAFAPNTRRAYRTAWAAFARWADGEGFQALPAAPAAVAAYLAARSEAGRSLSSLHLARQAIRAAHLEAGEADPSASEGVRRVLRGLSRQRAGEGGRRQAAALTAEALAAIRATAAAPRTGPTGPDGVPPGGPDPGSRGRRPRLRHARRHAPALRSGRARMGRCRAPAGWIGTAPGPPLEDRPGGRGSRPVPREGDRRCCPGDPPRQPGSGRPRVRPPLRTLRGPPPRRHGQGRRARRRVLRTLPPRRDGPRSRGLRGLRRRRPDRGPVGFRPDARPLRPGRAGRTRGRRPVLRGVRVPPGPRIPARRPQDRP